MQDRLQTEDAEPEEDTTTESMFETAEVGDWFEREAGMVDYYKVVGIGETFGDRVEIVMEARSLSTRTDNETVRRSFMEPEFENEFEPIQDPSEN